MEIKTKFDINNLVKHKFEMGIDSGLKTIPVLEVMEVIAQKCYAGTQVFYLCKQIIVQKNRSVYDELNSVTQKILNKANELESVDKYYIHPTFGNDVNDTGWKKYREDELVEAPQNEIDIILGTDKTETK